MSRQRELDDEAVHLLVAVQAVYLLEQPLFGHVIVKADERAAEAARFARLHLVGNVCLAAAVVPYQYRREVGRSFAGCDHLGNFLRYLALERGCGFFSIEYLHSHSGVNQAAKLRKNTLVRNTFSDLRTLAARCVQ